MRLWRESIPPKHPPTTPQLTPSPWPSPTHRYTVIPMPARSKLSKIRLGVRRAESPPLAERESGVGGRPTPHNPSHIFPPNPHICLTRLSKGVIISCDRTNI